MSVYGLLDNMEVVTVEALEQEVVDLERRIEWLKVFIRIKKGEALAEPNKRLGWGKQRAGKGARRPETQAKVDKLVAVLLENKGPMKKSLLLAQAEIPNNGNYEYLFACAEFERTGHGIIDLSKYYWSTQGLARLSDSELLKQEGPLYHVEPSIEPDLRQSTAGSNEARAVEEGPAQPQ